MSETMQRVETIPTVTRFGRASILAAALLISAFLLASFPCLAQDLPESLRKVFQAGVAAEKAGRLEEAEKAFQQVLRAGGKAAFVYNNLGIVYQERGDQARAITQFREAIRLQPDFVAPRILLGASLLATGQVSDATRELERAVHLQPREALARVELAKAYERGNNLGGTIDQYRALREMAPENPEYAYRLGRAYAKLAEWSFQEIKRLTPDSARLYQILAEAYAGQGHTEQAMQAYGRAARIDPRLPGIHLALAQLFLQQGETAKARQEIDRELSIVPESVAAQAFRRRLEQGEPKP